MSFFSFRRDRTAKASAAATDAQSVEVVRKRARQRLIGAAVLVLIAVVGLPLLFDSQPRPVPVDIAIEIPSRSTVKPGTPIASAPAAAAPAAPAAEKAATPAPVPATASLQDKEEIVSKPAAAAPAQPAPAQSVPAPKSPEGAGDAVRGEGKRAQNLLEGKSGEAAASARVVVQVGAYADAGKAREVRQKLEKAGLKTYTQVVDTKDGQRTRVRVGPYPSREEAEKAVAKIKALDLPASILTL
jgi:DedD protein